MQRYPFLLLSLPNLDLHNMEFESSRIAYRRMTEAYFSMVADPEIMHHITGRGMTEKEAQDRFQISMSAAATHPLLGSFMMHARIDHQLIGIYKFVPDQDDPTAVEVGYMLRPAYWRQGYATEATQCMINFAHTLPDLHRLTAIASPHNLTSTHILTQAGFQLLRSYEEHGLPAVSFELAL
jgi:[ribosomal protein S5]-alanine N-acetyltransferase